MCGLMGVYSTNFGAWEYDTFEKLLLLNVFRGDDSTGIIRAQIDGRIHSRKSLLPSPGFIMSTASDIIEDDKDGKKFKKPWTLMGHTRAATKGSVILKNAHPFGFDSVVGMHNGTIHTSFKHKNEYETDSEAFYRNLNDYGLVAALEEIEAYDTAYAFQWIDKKAKTLNFVKNDKRPLHFTYAFAGTTLVWSSELRDIEYVLKTKKYDNHEGWDRSKTDKFFTLGTDDHLVIPLGKDPERDVELKKLTIKKKHGVYSGHTTAGRAGTTQSGTTYRTRTSTNPEIEGKGEWVETSLGWRFQYSEGTATKNLPSVVNSEEKTSPPSTNSSRSQNQTSTTTGGTGGKTGASQSTSTASSQEAANKGSGEQRRGRSYRDTYGPSRLKTLDWLRPGSRERTPASNAAGDKPDPAGDLDMSSALDHLFDTDHETANNATSSGSNVVPFKAGKNRRVSGGGSLRGYQGELITEAEFAHHLKQGCFCCSEPLSLDNPHDFAQINNIHWWTRDLWACDYCYHTSEGDWVRRSIEDDWNSEDKSNNVKG